MIPRCPSLIAISILTSVSTIAGCANQLLKQGEAETTSSSASSSSSGVGGAGAAGATSSSASSSGQGGSAGQGGCEAAAMPACTPYSGPLGAEGVGECRASSTTCDVDGAWSACDQEVLPSYESCASNTDANCDGVAPCTGKPIGGFAAPGAQSAADELILAMATGDSQIKGVDGSVYAVGIRAANLNPPPGTNHRVLVWRRMSDGTMQDWSSKFAFTPSGGSNGAFGTGVVVLPKSGDVVISGIFYGGTLTIGGANSPNAMATSSFLARFSATGTLVKALYSSGGGSLSVLGISADGADKVYAVGSYLGAPQIDTTVLPSAMDTDGLVFSLSSDFSYLWHRVSSGIGRQSVDTITMIDDTAMAIATTFVNTMAVTTAGGSQVFSGGMEPDMLVSRARTSDGATEWTNQIAGNGPGARVEVGGLAANGSTVAIGGRFMQTVNIGGVQYTNVEAAAYDSFMATIGASDGQLTSHVVNGAIGSQEIRNIALDANGDLILTGHYSGSFPLPGLGLATSAGVDAFVIKTDAQFNGRWAVNFGDSATQIAYAATIGKNTGHIFAGGGFQGMMDVGGAMLSSTGGLDAFLLQLGD